MPVLLALLADGYGVGLEWLVYATFAVPAVLLILLWWLGSKRIV